MYDLLERDVVEADAVGRDGGGIGGGIMGGADAPLVPAPEPRVEPSTIPAKLRAALHADPGAAGLADGELLRRAWPGLRESLHGLLEPPARPDPVVEVPPPALRHGDPADAQFLTRRFANHAGSRTYRLYVPGVRPVGPMPLLVVLHGGQQTAEEFAEATGFNDLAEEMGWMVAWPAQATSANPSRFWNWYRPEDQRRDEGEPALIAGITLAVMHDWPVDPRRVYVVGLSAGGAMAAAMGVLYPDLYAAVGVHSGLAYGVADDLSSAFSAMRAGGEGVRVPARGRAAPAIVFHGDRDGTVHPANGEAVFHQFAAGRDGLVPTVEQGRRPGGRAYSRTIHADAAGLAVLEHWTVHGAGHAWSGGCPSSRFADPDGPDAADAMMRFFARHALPPAGRAG